MNNKIQERISEFMQSVREYEKENAASRQRLKKCLEMFNEGNKNCIFLYSTSPLDYWDGWNNYHASHFRFYNHELLHGTSPDEESAYKKCMRLEHLLVEGLTNFPELRQESRGEPIKFIEIECSDAMNESRSDFAICIKMDNNGTCYAFSRRPDLEELLPHDFGCEWELTDAYI